MHSEQILQLPDCGPKSGNGLAQMKRTGIGRSSPQKGPQTREELALWIADNVVDAIIKIDGQGRIDYWNQKAAAMFGYSAEEAMGRDPHSLLVPTRYREANQTRLALFQEKGEGHLVDKTVELVACRKGGVEFPIELSLTPVLLDGLWGAVAIIRDITERKRMGEALRQSEQNYRALFNSAMDAIFVHDAETGAILAVNDTMLQMFGFEREDVPRLGNDDISLGISPYSVKEARQLVRAASVEGAQVFEWQARRKSGDLFWAEVALKAATIDEKHRVLAFVHDITQRKQAEDALRWRTAFLEALVDSTPDRILVVDSQGKKILQNQRLSELWKIPQPIAEDLDDTKQVQFAISQTKHPQRFAEKVADLYAHPSEAGHDEIELIDGTVLDGHSCPVQDKHGKYYGRIWLHRDITAQKRLIEQLLRSQCLESIGTLASGVAHDLNNVLAPILMAVGLLPRSATSAEDLELLNTIQQSALRGSEIVRQLLTFGRGTQGERTICQPDSLLKEMFKVVRQTFPKNLEVRHQISTDLWAIRADLTQIHQVLMNLCVNARDAMPRGGTLTISAENIVADAAYAAMNPELKPGPYVILQIADTGIGIPPEIMEKIFDPFFTTKEPGKGTGLGLWTVQGIIKSHGGFLQLHSRVGVGTQFKVYLPAVAESQALPAAASVEVNVAESVGDNLQESQALPAAASVESAFCGHAELILVVDDEKAVRAVAQRALEANGYRVVTAADGAEALITFSRSVEPFQALLTDMVMPVMDGLALIRALRAHAPRLPILAMSGMPEHEAAVVQAGLTAEAFLEKPFGAEALIRVLNKVLGQGTESGVVSPARED